MRTEQRRLAEKAAPLRERLIAGLRRLKNDAATGDRRYTPCQCEFLPQGVVKRAAFEPEEMEGAGGFFHLDAVAGFDVHAVAAIDGENHRAAVTILGRELDDGMVR